MKISRPHLITALLTAAFSLSLTACNNESNNKPALMAEQSVQKYRKNTVLSGKVNTKKGPINNGTVSVTDSDNKKITSTEVSESGQYRVTIPANTELPIILTFKSAGGQEKITLTSVAIHPALKKYDINDLTTLIAKKARSLGGYSTSNMTIAADSTVGVPDANKTSTGFRGDPTAQYGGWH